VRHRSSKAPTIFPTTSSKNSVVACAYIMERNENSTLKPSQQLSGVGPGANVHSFRKK
jgi:hypothetical protein